MAPDRGNAHSSKPHDRVVAGDVAFSNTYRSSRPLPDCSDACCERGSRPQAQSTPNTRQPPRFPATRPPAALCQLGAEDLDLMDQGESIEAIDVT
jgi:hypothetical protein